MKCLGSRALPHVSLTCTSLFQASGEDGPALAAQVQKGHRKPKHPEGCEHTQSWEKVQDLLVNKAGSCPTPEIHSRKTQSGNLFCHSDTTITATTLSSLEQGSYHGQGLAPPS